ncbi:MAG: membrane protein insertase YidC [Actinomycetota bacterium]
MLALAPWQWLLDALGWVLAGIYNVIPNYGISIIILTVLIRFLVLPLGMKQIKSMGHMQAIQPKVKELQKKYKNNKPKLQEEQMKLYKEAGVNPLGGCLPLLLQFPLLIAMYSVIRPVPVEPVPQNGQTVYEVVNNHLPVDSTLFNTVVTHGDTDFLWMNLQCSLMQAGTQAPIMVKDPTTGEAVQVQANQPIVNAALQPLYTPTGQPILTADHLDCGAKRFPAIIPFALLLLIMVGTTFYQQIQMQRASPPGAQSQQQQAIMRVMPLMFAFLGLNFPAGLVLYWTVSNAFQIGQQTFLLRAGHIGPEALEKRMAEQRARADNPPAKPGVMARFMEKAQDAQRTRTEGTQKPPASGPRKPPPKGSTGKKPTPKQSPPPNPKSRGPRPGNQLGKQQPPEEQG